MAQEEPEAGEELSGTSPRHVLRVGGARVRIFLSTSSCHEDDDVHPYSPQPPPFPFPPPPFPPLSLHAYAYAYVYVDMDVYVVHIKQI